MSRKLTILGGPRDGEVVDWIGHELRLPVPPSVSYIAARDVPPPVMLKVDRYVARQDFDGRWWYVREGRW